MGRASNAVTMAVSSHGGPFRPTLLWVSPRSRSICMVWSMQPRFCSSTANNWKASLHLEYEHGLSHNDELLTGVVESKQHGSMFSARRWADSVRWAPWTSTRSNPHVGARAVQYSDKSLWHRVTLEVKNSKKLFRQGPQGVVDIESSLPRNSAQNSSQDPKDGRANSGFSSISCAPTTLSIQATTFDVKASSSQVKEQTGDELGQLDAEKKAYCKNGKGKAIVLHSSQGVVDIESSVPRNSAQNSSKDSKDGRANSGFRSISCAPTTLSIQATTFDVKANSSQVKEQTSDELGQVDAEKKAYCKKGKGATTKGVHTNGLSLKKELKDDKFAHERGDVNGKYAVAKRDDFVEQTQMGCEQEFRMKLCSIFDKVLVVDSVAAARKVVRRLTKRYKHHVHACDTEVSKIDVKQETPVGHGEIICFSIYSGEEVDYGNGKSCIWVDVLDGGGKDILAEFAPFFGDPSIKKVWHNYSFDFHVIENYGIKMCGFHADTMHMARLWDSSRKMDGGYSLEALTSDPNVMSENRMGLDEGLMGKISMKTIFGRRKMKRDGSMGKLVTVPPVEELQKEERRPWICYSSLDSISTLKLYQSLKSKLSKMPWVMDGNCRGNMLDFYENYWRPFGELLVQMEAEGMLVDRAYLREVEKVAIAEQQIAANHFRNWASKYCPDARYMNVGSDTQLRQLLFGGFCNRKNHDECLPREKTFRVPNIDNVIQDGKKAPKKYCDIILHKIGSPLQTDLYTASGWPSVSGDALKAIAGKVSAEYDFSNDDSEPPLVNGSHYSDKKDIDISAYGTAYAAFGGGQEGMEACHAIAALCDVCTIDSLISNFILPLQGSDVSGKNGRIHCSLNINTETGRLSARRPNLQNQPALEKDRYKIRQAFIAAPGNSLIVADYGQLELRILAHLADCKSMKEAFEAGGDFHSRTAMNMYPYICEAIERKEVLLEWHPQPGEEQPPVPLLKDVFGSERRKAKMLNFSIAYGKTPMGLAKDWKVSVREATQTVHLWYKERQEVLRWQEARKKEAEELGCVYTLLGRARRFPSMARASPLQRGHIERAAINTPVQGSAADVAMCAMLEIGKNERLKELGWKLILQVHDEVILEGPSESAEEAKGLVVQCMAKPFDGKNILRVDLAVDAKCAQNWYAAK